jgi:hypothetical protein
MNTLLAEPVFCYGSLTYRGNSAIGEACAGLPKRSSAKFGEELTSIGILLAGFAGHRAF